MKNFMIVSFYLSVMMFILSLSMFFISLFFLLNSKVLFVEWELLSLNSSMIIMTMLFDWMSLSFMSFVLFISSMVLFYSTSYMADDKYFYRFIMLVYLFVISMLFLIISPNMISILLGWDGLGLVSYCLVIYYQNEKSANAGMLTILSNRIGDVAILLVISWMLNFGSWNFYYIYYVKDFIELKLVIFLVVLAAMTKSAQIPFSAWLPAAMAAPTPVSSLVHSSTLVTAGVYLLIRFHALLGESSILLFVSVMTMFMSGVGANFENDLKKIIALSTLSQLGVMMMTLSLGFYELSFFHLLSHALFKSLLFLCAGVMIHGMGNIQDIRFMGGLLKGLPLISVYFFGASLALCGFPFLSGFYSKDVILEMFLMGSMNYFFLMIIFLATMMTMTYSFRLIFFLFFKNMGPKSLLYLGEDSMMFYPMFFLFILSIFSGSMMSWIYFPMFVVVLPYFLKLLVIVGLIFFFVISLMFMFTKNFFLLLKMKLMVFHHGMMWLLPFLSTALFIPVLKMGSYLLKNFDHGWLEQYSGQYIYLKITSSSLKIDFLNNLNLKSYLMIFFLFVVFIFLVI
uniref:NADH dehydrogenase subunit 5 n=1 Tax=Tomocerus caputiviolaceus TaxID=2763923 RepID=UPI0021D52102|nr:NADH dehydrogenase subunit 5 [Tomocerus caputiviolaceus]UXC95411.1 NADH dehydrogenase subunit 5 [Tomocerus caputiviolaceus]